MTIIGWLDVDVKVRAGTKHKNSLRHALKNALTCVEKNTIKPLGIFVTWNFLGISFEHLTRSRTSRLGLYSLCGQIPKENFFKSILNALR